MSSLNSFEVSKIQIFGNDQIDYITKILSNQSISNNVIESVIEQLRCPSGFGVISDSYDFMFIPKKYYNLLVAANKHFDTKLACTARGSFLVTSRWTDDPEEIQKIIDSNKNHTSLVDFPFDIHGTKLSYKEMKRRLRYIEKKRSRENI